MKEKKHFPEISAEKSGAQTFFPVYAPLQCILYS